jgi:high-affinity iron transporter
MQVLVYLGTILVMVALMQVSSAGKRRQLRTA